METGKLAQPDSVHALYSDHHSWLLRWLRSRLGCAHHAADLAHDTFVRVIERRDPEQVREPRAILTTIAKGLLVNHWRRQDIERAYLAALAARGQSLVCSPEQISLVIEALVAVDAMLSTLPDKPRRAFLLAQLDGLTYREIAEELSVSERMVKKYMAATMLHCLKAAAS